MKDPQSRLQSLLFLENELKRKFKQKLETVHATEWKERMELASSLWRADSEVDSLLKRAEKVSHEVNLNFIEFSLLDILKTWYAFLGFHEEMMFAEYKEHPIMDLIEKRHGGYCFNNTSSYMFNRFEEYLSNGHLRENNMRGEMATFYIGLFTSRLLFSPINKHEILTDLNLDRPLKIFIRSNIPMGEVRRNKTDLMRFIQGHGESLMTHTLSKEKYEEIVKLALANLINIISITDFLKEEAWEADWQVFRPSFYQKSKDGWTTATMMCRIYEGPLCSPEFPFESIRPKTYTFFS